MKNQEINEFECFVNLWVSVCVGGCSWVWVFEIFTEKLLISRSYQYFSIEKKFEHNPMTSKRQFLI